MHYYYGPLLAGLSLDLCPYRARFVGSLHFFVGYLDDFFLWVLYPIDVHYVHYVHGLFLGGLSSHR